MRALLQRVRSGRVMVSSQVTGEIGKGFVLFLGIHQQDGEKECDYLVEKILHLRVFEDDAGKMNKSLLDVNGQVLVVSQFTLYADCKKGRRPAFTEAARPEIAVPLYERFILKLKSAGLQVETGRFGADMLVSIENDGPVTIWLDTDILCS